MLFKYILNSRKNKMKYLFPTEIYEKFCKKKCFFFYIIIVIFIIVHSKFPVCFFTLSATNIEIKISKTRKPCYCLWPHSTHVSHRGAKFYSYFHMPIKDMEAEVIDQKLFGVQN